MNPGRLAVSPIRSVNPPRGERIACYRFSFPVTFSPSIEFRFNIENMLMRIFKTVWKCISLVLHAISNRIRDHHCSSNADKEHNLNFTGLFDPGTSEAMRRSSSPTTMLCTRRILSPGLLRRLRRSCHSQSSRKEGFCTE